MIVVRLFITVHPPYLAREAEIGTKEEGRFGRFDARIVLSESG
jgi:hypothetical protein